jgi:hypothetical protein
MPSVEPIVKREETTSWISYTSAHETVSIILQAYIICNEGSELNGRSGRFIDHLLTEHTLFFPVTAR